MKTFLHNLEEVILSNSKDFHLNRYNQKDELYFLHRKILNAIHRQALRIQNSFDFALGIVGAARQGCSVA